MTHTMFVDARSSLLHHDCFGKQRMPHQNTHTRPSPFDLLTKAMNERINGRHKGIDYRIATMNRYAFSKGAQCKVNGTYVCVSRGLEGRTTLIVGRSFWWCLASRQVGRETQFKPKSVKCRRDQRYRCPWVIIHRSCSFRWTPFARQRSKRT